ncbi:MAG: hypothetical protein M0C28_35825 [Candidatus Moduliflexus flocculans]|nr:hypothetical protein [Candidatus Moduliflexus flocculans]
MTNWWHLATDEVARKLRTDLKAGLSSAAAAGKLADARPERAPGEEGPRAPGHLPRPVQEPDDRRPHRRRPDLRLPQGVGRRRGHPGHRHPQRHPRPRPGVPGREEPGRPAAALRPVVQGRPRTALPGSSRPASSCPATSSRSRPATTSRPTAGSSGTPRTSPSRKPA